MVNATHKKKKFVPEYECNILQKLKIFNTEILWEIKYYWTSTIYNKQFHNFQKKNNVKYDKN